MVVEADEDGNTVFQMQVIINPELERDILAYGDGVKVIAPKSLRDSIARRLKAAAGNYD